MARKSHAPPPVAKECAFVIHAPGGWVCRLVISCYDRYPVYFYRFEWQVQIDHELVRVRPLHVPAGIVQALEMHVYLAAREHLEPWDQPTPPFVQYRTRLKGTVRSTVHRGDGRAWHRAEPARTVRQNDHHYTAYDWRNYCSLEYGTSRKQFPNLCALLGADLVSQLADQPGWRMERRPSMTLHDPQVAYIVEELIGRELQRLDDESWATYEFFRGP